MFLATYQTRHFEFSALGKSEREARRQCKIAWEIHVAEYSKFSVNIPWGKFSPDDVCVTEMITGAPYRDGELLTDSGGEK